MVRLRAADVTPPLHHAIIFQFLNGTIKSVIPFTKSWEGIAFQFLNGTIKRNRTKKNWDEKNVFQFLNGTIKRWTGTIADFDGSTISIPKWYD